MQVMSHSTEKEAIERETAGAFLKRYNEAEGTAYEILQHSDAPDFICRDGEGNTLKLEITMTEDRSGDIPSLLGRSDARSPEALKRHLEAVDRGEESIFASGSSSDSICHMAASRIQAKLSKDYGPNTALVVRDTSPLEWDWRFEIERLIELLDLSRNPYDKGIWIVSYSRQQIFRVV
jgi:hypothetical protein